MPCAGRPISGTLAAAIGLAPPPAVRQSRVSPGPAKAAPATLPSFGEGLAATNPLAVAALRRKVGDRHALADAQGRDQGDVGRGVLGFRQRHRCDDAILRRQLDAADAARGQTHRADVVLGEADGLSLRRHQQELAPAGTDTGPEQLVAVIQPDDLRICARLIHQIS